MGEGDPTTKSPWAQVEIQLPGTLDRRQEVVSGDDALLQAFLEMDQLTEEGRAEWLRLMEERNADAMWVQIPRQQP